MANQILTADGQRRRPRRDASGGGSTINEGEVRRALSSLQRDNM